MSRRSLPLGFYILVILGITSCSVFPTPTITPPSFTTTIATPTAHPTATNIPPTGTPATSILKVLVFINGKIDEGFFNLMLTGIKQAGTELGFETIYFEAGSGLNGFLPSLQQTANGEYDILVAIGQNMVPAIQNVAVIHPDKRFIVLDGGVDFSQPGLSNVVSVTIKLDEGSYLAGLYAGYMTQITTLTGINPYAVVGVVGGLEAYASTYVHAYKQGAIAAGIKPENVLIGYANSYSDVEAARQAALQLYSAGADIVYQIAGSAGLGVFQAAQQSNGYAIGIDLDQAVQMSKDHPELSTIILTSVVKDYSKVAYEAMTLVQNKPQSYGTNVNWGIAEGVVTLVKNEYYDTLTPDKVKDKINQAQQDLEAGILKITIP
jgi:basic membrane protein A and related proteins